MDFSEINKIIDAGASSERDLNLLADAMGVKLDFIDTMYDIDGKHTLKNGNYIFLISPSEKNKNGHWVALKVRKNNCHYFDSYGLPPPDRIANACPSHIIWNKKQVQDLRSSHCGLYCLYWLKKSNGIFDTLVQYNEF